MAEIFIEDLHLAAKAGNNLHVCEALDEGADINHTNTNGDTALILTSFPDVVTELLVRGADEKIKTNSGNIDAMIMRDNSRVPRLLLHFTSPSWSLLFSTAY